MIYNLLISSVFLDNIGHSLCEESSILLFLITSMGGNAWDIGILKSSRSFSGSIGSWITGIIVDKGYLEYALFFSTIGTTTGRV